MRAARARAEPADRPPLGLRRPERLAGPGYDSRLTITLREAPGGATELTRVHARLDALQEAMPDVAGSVGPGWEQVLDTLARTLEKGRT